MTLSSKLRRLAELVERLESAGVDVADVSPRPEPSDGGLRVDLTVTLPADPSVGAAAADAPRAGAAAAGGAIGGRPPVPLDGRVGADDGDVDGVGADDTGDGDAVAEDAPSDDVRAGDVRVEEARSDDEPRVEDTRAEDTRKSGDHVAQELDDDTRVDDARNDVADDGRPGADPDEADATPEAPSAGPASVECAVPDCDRTFDSEHGMKVHVGKTHGERARTDGAGAASATSDASPVALPDVVDAPAGIGVADVVDAVRGANTLFEVQRSLGLDRPATQSLLETLDLLDLVHGRVRDRREREAMKAEIEDRIRRHAAVDGDDGRDAAERTDDSEAPRDGDVDGHSGDAGAAGG